MMALAIVQQLILALGWLAVTGYTAQSESSSDKDIGEDIVADLSKKIFSITFALDFPGYFWHLDSLHVDFNVSALLSSDMAFGKGHNFHGGNVIA